MFRFWRKKELAMPLDYKMPHTKSMFYAPENTIVMSSNMASL
jgi:hypothetical protein